METDNLPISLNLEISSGISSESSSPSSPSLLELIDPILLNDSTHLARSQTAADQRPATSTVSETPWSPEYAFKGVTSQQFAIERGEVEMRMESDGDSEDERYEYYPTLSSDVERRNRFPFEFRTVSGVYDDSEGSVSEEREGEGSGSGGSAGVNKPARKKRKVSAGQRSKDKTIKTEPYTRVPRPLSLPSHETIREHIASAHAERRGISKQDSLNHLNALRTGQRHWSLPKREEEDAKIQALHEAFIELLLTQMDPTTLAELRSLRPEAFDQEGKLKHELRKRLQDIYGSIIGNWPPVECLKEGVPVEAGKGTSMTESFLTKKGLTAESIAFNDICVFYLTNEWTSTYPIDRLFTEEGKETMYQQYANGLAPLIKQGLPEIAFGVDAQDHLLELDNRGYLDLDPLPVKIPITLDDGSVELYDLHVYEVTIPNYVDDQTGQPASTFAFFTHQLCTFGVNPTSMKMRIQMDLHVKSFFSLTPSSVPLPPAATDLVFVKTATRLLALDFTDPFYMYINRWDKIQRDSSRVYTNEQLEKIDISSFTSFILYTQRHSVELLDPEVLAYSRRFYPMITEEVRNSQLHLVSCYWRIKGRRTRGENMRKNETEEDKLKREEKEADEERRKGMSHSQKNLDTRRRNETEEETAKREEKEADEERRKGMTFSEKMLDTKRKSESEEDRAKREKKEADEERREGMSRSQKILDTKMKKAVAAVAPSLIQRLNAAALADPSFAALLGRVSTRQASRSDSSTLADKIKELEALED